MRGMLGAKNNIILIGFMGVGKGMIARELACMLDMFAVDSDDLIESINNKKIKNIFKDEGEKFFRQQEQKLALWFCKNVKNTILSTGGGFSVYVKDLKKLGKIVFLDDEFDSIIKGLKNSPNSKKKIAKRPLLQNMDEALKLFEVRREIYTSLAHIRISVGGKSSQEICEEISQKL